MRKVLIPVAVIALAIAAATLGGRSENAAAAPAGCAKANLDLVKDGQLSIGTDNPAFPPWFAGGETKGRPWKINDPAKGQGLRVGGRLRGREAARLRQGRGRLGLHAVQQGDRAGQEGLRLRDQPDLVHAGAGEGAHLQRLVLQRQPVDRRPEGEADLVGALGQRPAQVQARRTARDDELPVHRQQHQAVAVGQGLRHERRRRRGAEERPDRRPRRRPADRVLRHRGAGAERQDHRPVRRRRERRSASGWSSRRATRSSPA